MENVGDEIRTMPIEAGEVIQFIQDIASNENIRVTISGSVRGGVAAGCAAAAGGLLFGPIGLAIGSIIGGVGAAVAMRDRFVPLPQVIANMSRTEKQILADRIERIMREVNATDFIAFAALATSGSTLRGRVIEEVLNYVQQEVQLAVT